MARRPTPHVWVTQPTQKKFDRMLAAFLYAYHQNLTGTSYVMCQVFAGYYAERVVMDSGRIQIDELFDGCIRSGWRIMRGKNVVNYRTAWLRHRGYTITPALVESLPVPQSLDTPWQILHDMLVDADRGAEAALLKAQWYEGE